jgi:hypothetical protein
VYACINGGWGKSVRDLYQPWKSCNKEFYSGNKKTCNFFEEESDTLEGGNLVLRLSDKKVQGRLKIGVWKLV